jgi:Protein of unknown function (DUF3096)
VAPRRILLARLAQTRSRATKPARATKPTGNPMNITAAHITPLVALIAGILILVMPRLLNYVVAIYLIIVGLMGLNGIYHYVH